MPTLTTAQKTAIQRIVSPERARFDLEQRRALSRDDGIRPPRLWPLTGRTIADGVVWPDSEQEIVEVVQFARAEGIPLVARGGGTAAAGGAVPTDGGLVVDLGRLSGVVEIGDDGDECAPGEHLVDVCAGTLWSSVMFALDRHGYVLTGSDVTAAGAWELDRDPYLLETSVPGIFACGDVRSGPVKRVAAAVGEGSMAIAFVHQYLREAETRDERTQAPAVGLTTRVDLE